MSTTVCCLCMKDNDFSSHIFVSIIFCIHLHWHRACLCVCASNDAMQNAIDERAAYIYIYIYIFVERERESARMTASFVVHHVERILFLLFFFSLSRLVTDVDAFSLSLSHTLLQTYHQAIATAQH